MGWDGIGSGGMDWVGVGCRIERGGIGMGCILCGGC